MSRMAFVQPRPTTFTASTAIVARLKRLFGLHVGVKDPKKKPSKMWSPKALRRISLPWGIYAIVMHLYFCKAVLDLTAKRRDATVSVLDYAMDVLFNVIGPFCSVTAVVWTFMHTDANKKLASTVDKYDERFAMLGRAVDNARLKRFTLKAAALVLLYWVVYFFCYVVITCQLSKAYCLYNLFVKYHSHRCLSVDYLDTLTFLRALGHRFSLLNEKINELQSTSLSNEPRLYIVTAKTQRSGNRHRLVHCRDLHRQLCDITDDFNTLHSIRMLANILLCFVIIFISVFSAAFGYTKDVTSSQMNSSGLDFLVPLLLGAESSLKIYYLAKYSNSVRFKAHETGAVLDKISTYSNDEEFKNEAFHFSQQTTHNNVNITACGMFPIDFSLLYNVASVVTTYVVILIQFSLALKYNIIQPTMRVPTFYEESDSEN